MFDELIEVGNIVRFTKGKPCNFAMISVVRKKEVVLTIIEDNSFQEDTIKISIDEFKRGIDNKEIFFSRCDNDFGDLTFIDLRHEEQNEVCKKRAYLDPILENNITKITEKNIKNIINKTAQSRGEKAPHWQTIRNWWNDYKAAGFKLKGLFPRHRYKGNRLNKVDKKVIEIINDLADEYYSESQPLMTSIVRSVRAQVNKYNLENPSSIIISPTYKAIRDRVLNRSYEYQQIKRKGKNTMESQTGFRRAVIQSEFVLDRVEIDHTEMDIYVTYDDKKTLAGRPQLTILIDHFSEMILGFLMSFDPPSAAVASAACLNAFLPKAVHTELGIKYNWPARGVPKKLVSDNAKHFWGESFSITAKNIGFTVQYSKVKKPRYKGTCERFFGKMESMFLDGLPGVVKKPDRCGDNYDPRQEAIFTFTELKKRFLKWVIGVHHNMPIEKKNMATPNELWAESEEMLPIVEEEENSLRLDLLETFNPTLGRHGVQRVNEEYCNIALKDLFRRDGGGKVVGKYSSFDLGMVYILDEKNQKYIPVRNKYYESKKGVSEYVAKKIRSNANKIKNEKLTNTDLVNSEIELENERKKAHEKNNRRKTQTTTSKYARAEGLGRVDVMPKNQVEKLQKQNPSETRKRRVKREWSSM